ncbi:MAG: hypothetical protein ACOY0T_08295 [Myxococcota bacterium]
MPRTRRLRPARVLVITALSGLTAWACGDSDKEKIQAVGLSQGCNLNSECINPLVCTFARCHAECAKDRDCPGEQRCVKGTDGSVCQLPVETDCTKSTTVCKGTQTCGIDGECRDTCTKDTDCTTGQVCAPSGECASTEATKDKLDPNGNIVPDPFVDPDPSSSGGSGGGGNVGKGGSTGKGGTVSTTGGADNGGAGGEVPMSSGGKATTGGKTGAGGTAPGSGGITGTAGDIGQTAGAGGEGGSGPFQCPAGKADCDPTNPYDCETYLTLPTSCGACDVGCMSVHGTSVCDATTMTCKVTGACQTGYADCNSSGNDGCEVTLATDAKNCGQCGRDCGGGTCNSGQCGAAIVFDPTGATSLSYSYYGPAMLTGASGTTLVKANTSLGSATEIRVANLPTTPATIKGTPLVTLSGVYIQGMHADANNVYYAQSGSPNSTILWKPLTGMETTAPKTAVTMPDTYPAKIITSNATAFYMVNNYNVILSATKTLTGSGSTASALAGITSRSTVSELVVAGAYLYWLESPNVVYAYSLLNGGAPVAVDSTTQSGYSSYQSLTTDGLHVYWTTINGASSKVRRISASVTPSTAAVEDVAIGIAQPSNGIAVDANYVYYYYSSATVWRVPKDGSLTPSLVGNVNGAPYFYNLFAVDSGYVYGAGNAGQIVRVAKAPSAG